jgi:hypothetical protein
MFEPRTNCRLASESPQDRLIKLIPRLEAFRDAKMNFQWSAGINPNKLVFAELALHNTGFDDLGDHEIVPLSS